MKKYMKLVILCGIIAALLELTLFNFRHYESMGYREPEEVTTIYHGLSDNGDGTFTAIGDDCSIELVFPAQEIHNLKADIENLSGESGINKVNVQLFAIDEGNALYYGVPQVGVYDSLKRAGRGTIAEHTVWHDLNRSQYLHLHLAGKASRIELSMDLKDGQQLRIYEMALNARQPLDVSVARIVAVFGVLLFIWCFRPKSPLYQHLYQPEKSAWQRWIIVGFALLQIAAFMFITEKVNFSKNPASSPYPALARVLAEGKVHLDIEPSEELMALENPYDTNMRSLSGARYFWDYAYYEGHYYVYFGLMPALVFYLPYYLVTGNDFPMQMDIHIMTVAYVAGCLLLLHQMIKKYFKSTPFLLYMLLGVSFIWSVGGVYTLSHPDFYSVPKYFSIVMTIWGLYFWLSSMDDKDENKVSVWRMVAGSFCMASVAGARTQMVLASFLAIPLFWKMFIKKTVKEIFTKKNILRFLAFLAPYIIVATILMTYNALRFGSPFDFGANYNLTTNDMTKRGVNLDRCGLAIFTYLFQLPGMVAQFPYITETNIMTGYMGTSIFGGMMGGILVCNPILLTVFCISKVKETLKAKRLFIPSIMLVIFGIVIAIADAQMAGILVGYIGDFAIFFFLAAFFVILSVLEKTRKSAYRSNWYQLILILCVFGLIYQMLTLFVGTNINENTWLFYRVRYLVEFWL